MTAPAEPARAKVNLALHVVGRRADGLHLLDTLVAFPAIGDVLHARRAAALTLSMEGPMAAALAGTDPADNLVMKAAAALQAIAPAADAGAALRLIKHLPVAAGLGGGSADAAAAIRLLSRLWGIRADDARVEAIAVRLGADVPMCLVSRPLRATGIGERLEPLGPLPALGILLANPGVAVPTAEVFRRLRVRDGTGLPMPAPADAGGFVDHLSRCRNDLEAPAVAYAPAIGGVLEDLAGLPGCRLARMSGSGATCFGLFDDAGAARAAAGRLSSLRPGWWTAASDLRGEVSSPG